ncbi:hypothetical protein [Haladaptatus salinisoli]|uniref:hypothetical protein n=1 Tax=Haladaptatus salinisoli TaxID=2884876 RepID=UPI001D0A12CD|nr:hypothetical protein [Haladaptatus salinisoli]
MPDKRVEMGSIVDETKRYSAKDTLSREQYRRINRALDSDLETFLLSGRSFFVLGSYGENERERLTAVKNRLDREGHAFLMDDVPEAWEFWTTKFKVLANRADHIVGVYEHTDGGHEWEAGYLDHEAYRDKIRVLKRDYVDLDDPTDEPFDGMFSHFVRLLNRLDRVVFWEGPTDATDDELADSLLDATEALVEDIDRR